MDNKRRINDFGIVTFIIGLIWSVIFFLALQSAEDCYTLPADYFRQMALIFFIPALTMTICSLGVLFFNNWARRGLIISMGIWFILNFIPLTISFALRQPTLLGIIGFCHFFYFGIAILFFTRAEVKELFIKKPVIEQKNGDNEKPAEGK